MSNSSSPKSDPLASAIARHPLTSKGHELVAKIRAASRPARYVRGGGSITVRYPCRTTGRVMHLESHTFEFPVACALDDNPRTKYFIEQPVGLTIPVTKEGALRSSKVTFYPDFFVIEQDEACPDKLWIGFVSAKAATRMAELTNENPARYHQDDKGRWHDRLLEDFVRPTLGMDCRIDTDNEVGATLTRNINYLEDYFIVPVEVPDEIRKAAQAVVLREPGIAGTALREQCEGMSIDHLNQLAADRTIWFPRDSELMIHLDRVHFYPSGELGMAILAQPKPRAIETGAFDIAVGAKFTWGERAYEIANLRDDLVDCLVDGTITTFKRPVLERLFLDGQITPQAVVISIAAAVANLSSKAQRRLIARSTAVQQSIAAGKAVSPAARGWLRGYRRGEQVTGHGIFGIRPRFEQQGNWGTDGFRVSQADRDLAVRVIKEQFLSPEQRTLRCTYGVYCTQFKKSSLALTGSPMSRKTFTKVLVRSFTEEEIARARKGYKAANQAKLRAPLSGGRVDGGLPTIGDRSWERIHIDHTLLDIWVVDSVTHKVLGRVWLSVAVDAFSGKILAFVLSLEDPSKKLPMQLLRKIVRTYHRLPTWIVVDNGPEFHSMYFQTFAAVYGVRVAYRRPAMPRDGSPVEGGIGRLSALVHMLVGNAKPAKDPRSLDKDLLPDKRAIWTLRAVETQFMQKALAILNGQEHAIRGISHDEVFAESVAQQGLRAERRIGYDLAFLAISALPREDDLIVDRDGITVTTGTRKIAYWCEGFRDPKVQGTRVPVRDEPWDISRKYVKVNGRWELCRTERFRTELENRTEDEIESASKELTARLKHEPSLDEVAEFLLELQGIEKDLAREQRAARRRELVHEVGSDDTDDGNAAAVGNETDEGDDDEVTAESSATTASDW